MRRKSNLRLLFPLFLYLAAGLPVVADAAELETQELLDLYREGGPVMHVIALCSVATLALGAYCGIMYRKGKMMPAHVVAHLSELVSHRNLESAYEYCQAHPGPFTHALASALTKANYERDMFNKTAMENSVADDCFRSETKMMVVVNYLNTFAVLAPMIGLLGTVSGMITSFGALTAGQSRSDRPGKGHRRSACCHGRWSAAGHSRDVFLLLLSRSGICQHGRCAQGPFSHARPLHW